MLSSRTWTYVLSATFVFGAACASAGGGAGAGAGAAVSDSAQRLEPVETRLQRMAPGAVITRSGASISITIRGAPSSHSGQAATPLYVVNGMKMQPGPGGLLTGIDPNDITSIRVLRAASAGMYGIEGSDGVIEITTKRAGAKP